MEIQEVELDKLDLRYAHTRIKRSEGLAHLISSLERFGQITPVITVGDDPLILVDGYRRVDALRQMGRELVRAEVWHCREEDALVQVMARNGDRRWEPLEEAVLIRELMERFEFTQTKIAAVLGRDKSWISRRLGLLESLGGDVLELVRQGSISTWAATRVLMPLARANAEHGKRLAEVLSKEHLCTRDVATFWRYYQTANRKAREKMVDNPVLFLRSLLARDEEEKSLQVREGPEGKWLKDINVVRHLLRRLGRDVPKVLYSDQNQLDRRLIITAFQDAKGHFELLECAIRRDCAIGSNERDHRVHVREGGHDSGNQQDTQAIEEHGAPGGARGEANAIAPVQSARGDADAYQGSVSPLSGECSPGLGGA